MRAIWLMGMLGHMKWVICLVGVLLCACSPSSMEEFRFEGESIALKLTSDLQEVDTLADLEKIAPKIKKRLDKLTDLMLKLNKYQAKSHEKIQGNPPFVIGEGLKNEMKRVYAIEGCRAYFEEISSDALQKIQLNFRESTSQNVLYSFGSGHGG